MDSEACGRVRLLAAVLALVALADVAWASVAAFKAPFPVKVDLGAPTAYRNLYIHVPMAWSSYLLFGLALIFGILYLARRDPRYDRYTFYSVVLAEVYGVATLFSGMAWAKESWGAAWNWDPRETGVLFLILGYLGYFAVRSSISDPERRRLISSSYAVAAFTLVLISFISAYITESLHPRAEQTRQFIGAGNVGMYFGPKIMLATITAVLLLAVTVRLRDCEASYLKLAGGLVLLVGIASTLALVSPYLTDSPVRVLDAKLAPDGSIESLTLSGGQVVDFNPPIPSPIKPPRAADGQPSIIGHIVTVEDDTVKVVTHWAVALNLLFYSLVVGLLMLVAHKLARVRA